MVLIVSNESDHSTANVIDWLYHYKQSWLRLNGEDILNYSFPLEFQSSKTSINVGGNMIDIDKLQSIWYRRDATPVIPTLKPISDMPFSPDMHNYLKRESTFAKIGIYNFLQENIRPLGIYDSHSLNKITCLLLAKNCGLDTPSTLITTSKQAVKKLKLDFNRIITKAITNGFDLELKNEGNIEHYINYTEEVTENLLDAMPDTFFPSLFQELIEKELEVRTFFLGGKCYSMAIFSQLDVQTTVDYRKYSKEKNTRSVPYKLPDEIESKISNLMDKLSLNIGSLDIILSKDGRHFFLEVNPVGQYWTHSVICNYYLDKKIAEFLIKK